VHGRVVGSSSELRSFLREAVGEIYRYALALTGSLARAEQLTVNAAIELARHVDAVGAAPVSTSHMMRDVRRAVLDGRSHRRRGGRRASEEYAPPPREGAGAYVLASLDQLNGDERLALVLRHHDGMLLPDIARALGQSHAETEQVLRRAEGLVLPAAERFDDGAGADAIARLLRSVPGPPDALADRVWVSVESELVPEYAMHPVLPATSSRGLPWVGPSDGAPLDHEVTPAREAKRNGVTLLIGAAVLAAVLGIAALTAPHGGSSSKDASENTGVAGTAAAAATTAPLTTAPPTTVPATHGAVDRSLKPPPPDVIVDAGAAPAHPPDSVDRPVVTGDASTFKDDGPPLPNVSTEVQTLNGVSSVIVRRPDPAGGLTVWLVQVRGTVRDSSEKAPHLIQAWGIDHGDVLLALRVAGHPDKVVLVGLRNGGGGTWLRALDGMEPVAARANGSVLCLGPGSRGLSLNTYDVLS
jgi:DNA-directed RNA polymerase specialized sigma24 family protein